MEDAQVATFLQNRGFKFIYNPHVPVAKILATQTAVRNIRPVGLDEDKVAQYAVAMENGEPFPAVVLYPVGDGYGILTGCHRTSAMKEAKVEVTDAYIVELRDGVDDRTIEVLQRTLNTLNGIGYSRDEAILHALRLVQGLGWTAADAARAMHLRPQLITNRMAANAARDRARQLNIKLRDDVKDTSLVELSRIKNPDVFRGATELVQAARMTGPEVNDLSKELRSELTDVARVRVLERWRERLGPRIKETQGGRVAMPASPFRRAMAKLVKAERDFVIENFQSLMEHERKAAIAQVARTINQLQKLKMQLEHKRQPVPGQIAIPGQSSHARQ